MAARERSQAADHAMRVLSLGFLKRLHGRLGNRMLYAVKNEKLFKWSAAQQLCFTASALPLALETLKNEVPYFSQVERPATSQAEVLRFDDDGNIFSRETFSRSICAWSRVRPLRTKTEAPSPKS